jgi:hypothetical protein
VANINPTVSAFILHLHPGLAQSRSIGLPQNRDSAQRLEIRRKPRLPQSNSS